MQIFIRLPRFNLWRTSSTTRYAGPSYHDVKFVVGMISQKVNMPRNIPYSCK